MKCPHEVIVGDGSITITIKHSKQIIGELLSVAIWIEIQVDRSYKLQQSYNF